MSTNYLSNLSDAGWKCLQRHLPPLSNRGRPPTHSLRAIFEAIFYVLRTGCPWRYLPWNFPPWWRRSADPDAAAAVAALIPVAYWGPFFVALIVPGADIVDPGHSLTRIGGVPSPLFGASATILVAGLGWYLDHRGRPVGKCTTRSTF